jgi:N-acetylglucosamine malate deacetylase 1
LPTSQSELATLPEEFESWIATVEKTLMRSPSWRWGSPVGLGRYGILGSLPLEIEARIYRFTHGGRPTKAMVVAENVITRRGVLKTAAAGLTFLPEIPTAAGQKKTLLVVGAHMDDSEWGAGGVMFKALKAGHRVVVIQAVSDWSNWPPTLGREDKVKEGVVRVAQQMGVEKILLGYKYHYVPTDLEIKRRIAEIMDDVKPDVAIIISEKDYWTDHANAGRAGKDGIMFAHGYLSRAVKSPPLILTYAAAANQTYDFRPDTFVDISEVIDRVAWLINELGVGGSILGEKGPQYTSRLTLYGPAERGYPRNLELTAETASLLATDARWGDMCGVRYAEAFQTIRHAPRELW